MSEYPPKLIVYLRVGEWKRFIHVALDFETPAIHVDVGLLLSAVQASVDL